MSSRKCSEARASVASIQRSGVPNRTLHHSLRCKDSVGRVLNVRQCFPNVEDPWEKGNDDVKSTDTEKQGRHVERQKGQGAMNICKEQSDLMKRWRTNTVHRNAAPPPRF